MFRSVAVMSSNVLDGTMILYEQLINQVEINHICYSNLDIVPLYNQIDVKDFVSLSKQTVAPKSGRDTTLLIPARKSPID